MKSVYTKYELPGVPELGDSSKTKLHLLFVQGVLYEYSPAGHLRWRWKKPIVGFHGEQVSDDGYGVLVCYKTKKCNPLRFFSKSHHAWEWRWLRFCTRGYRAFWVLMGQWCCYILWQRFFGGSCYRSTSPWLATSIQSLPAGLPCRAVHGWF